MKSTMLGFFLALFFGPIGMLYSTVLGAIIMFLIGGTVTVLTAGIGAIVVLPVCAIWAAMACQSHNQRFQATIQAAAEAGARRATRDFGAGGPVTGAGVGSAPSSSITGNEGKKTVDINNPDMDSFL